MPDIKISDLPAATSASGAQQLEVNDGGVSKKITVDQIKAYAVPDDSITSAKIAAGAVGSSEIADGAVGTSELADAGVTALKVSDAIVSDLTAVTAASDDYVFVGDTSDAGKKKKSLISSLISLASAFASGTRLAFQQTSAPVGWTKDTTAAINDAILRLVTGTVGSGGSTAFSTFNGQTSVGATTLAESQIPSHTHSFIGGATAKGASARPNIVSANTSPGFTTNATGGGGSHTHSITTAIKYYDFIIASKD